MKFNLEVLCGKEVTIPSIKIPGTENSIVSDQGVQDAMQAAGEKAFENGYDVGIKLGAFEGALLGAAATAYAAWIYPIAKDVAVEAKDSIVGWWEGKRLKREFISECEDYLKETK